LRCLALAVWNISGFVRNCAFNISVPFWISSEQDGQHTKESAEARWYKASTALWRAATARDLLSQVAWVQEMQPGQKNWRLKWATGNDWKDKDKDWKDNGKQKAG
jgi:hypothetical protein